MLYNYIVCLRCLLHRGMHWVSIGHESGMRPGTHQVITLSVKLGEKGFGARPGAVKTT